MESHMIRFLCLWRWRCRKSIIYWGITYQYAYIQHLIFTSCVFLTSISAHIMGTHEFVLRTNNIKFMTPKSFANIEHTPSDGGAKEFEKYYMNQLLCMERIFKSKWKVNFRKIWKFLLRLTAWCLPGFYLQGHIWYLLDLKLRKHSNFNFCKCSR